MTSHRSPRSSRRTSHRSPSSSRRLCAFSVTIVLALLLGLALTYEQPSSAGLSDSASAQGPAREPERTDELESAPHDTFSWGAGDGETRAPAAPAAPAPPVTAAPEKPATQDAPVVPEADDATESPESTSTPSPAAPAAPAATARVPAQVPAQAAAPASPATDPDASWTQAWTSADATRIRAWFEANTGPTRPISGTVPGGPVRTQADADRLAGRTVTGSLNVSCTCVLQDFVLQNAELTITGGQVSVRNATIDGRGNTSLVGVFTARGSSNVSLSRVEITGHNDGIRAYAQKVTGEYVFIHGRATANPRNHHQDGIQTIGGATAFQRSYVDMTGANTSATLIKPDASAIPEASVNQSVMIGGSYTFHVHDGPKGAPRNVDLRDNITAPGYGRGLMSTWELSDPAKSMIPSSIRLSGTTRAIPLVDGAKI